MDLRSWIAGDLDTHRFQYQLTAGAMPTEKWALRPYDGANPISWLVWHTARWHDLAINCMVRDEETVWENGWADRIGIHGAPGTGFSDADVDALAAKADPVALDHYWHAVYDRTSDWLSNLSDAALESALRDEVDTDARYATAAHGLLPPAASWVQDFHRGQQGEFFVRWVAIGHNYWHLGEMTTVTTALGSPLG